MDSRTTPAQILVLTEDVSQRRKSVTGLSRDPQLAAFGEVLYDSELTLNP